VENNLRLGWSEGKTFTRTEKKCRNFVSAATVQTSETPGHLP